MTQSERDILNHFLVQVFNGILKTEEVSISDTNFPNLSLREIHILETVCIANESGADNSSTAIAAALRITPGTLTTAVSLLERKGFLRREKNPRDKRVVHIFATETGFAAQLRHDEFHNELVNDILSCLNEEEATVFVKALSNIDTFFKEKYLIHTQKKSEELLK